MLKPIGLSHWIMGDGYWNTKERTINLCTDNFTEEEVELLISTLHQNFGLLSTKLKRTKTNNNICWRIRFSSKKDNLDPGGGGPAPPIPGFRGGAPGIF
jgi:hypothetical protein